LSSTLIKSSFNVFVAGHGCCKQEIIAAAGPVYDISRFGVSFTSYPESADILIFQGFYNKRALKRFLDFYNEMLSPRWVIALGKCAIENLSHEEPDNILTEFKKRIKVDMFVPGCPPRPEAIIFSILRLIEKS